MYKFAADAYLPGKDDCNKLFLGGLSMPYPWRKFKLFGLYHIYPKRGYVCHDII